MDADRRPHRGRLDRREFLRYAGVGASASLLAGCQGGDDDGNGGGNGTVEGTPRSEPVRYGLLTQSVGLGETIRQSAELAVDHLNADGGVLGADAELVTARAQGGLGGGERAHRKLTREEDAEVTLGGLGMRTVMPSIAEAETLHFSTLGPSEYPAELVSTQGSPVGGDPEAEYEKYKYWFRTGPLNVPDLQQAQKQLLEAHADELGWETVSIVVEQTDASGQYVDRMAELAGEVGVEVGATREASGTLSDWSPVFDEIEEAGSDLALVVLVLGGTSFVTQWAAQQRDFEVGGIHLFSMLPSFWEDTDGACESVWTMNAVTPQTDNNPPHTGEFMEAFDEAFGTYPLFAGPLTYDAIHVHAHAVEELGTTNPEKLIPYLEDDLEYTEGVVFPETGFRPSDARYAHDPTWESIHESGVPVFQQWQSDEGTDRDSVAGGGIMEAFAPEGNRTADYVRPPWLR